MSSASRSSALLLLVVGLVVLAGILGRPKEIIPVAVTPRAQRSGQVGPGTAPHKGEEALPLSIRSSVRLKAGEAAIVGFWQVRGGARGFAAITPRLWADGSIQFIAKIVRISGKDGILAFPAAFSGRQAVVLKVDALKSLLKSCEKEQANCLQTVPTMTVEPGSIATSSILQTTDDGVSGNVVELTLQPSPPLADGGLEINLQIDVSRVNSAAPDTFQKSSRE